LTGKLGRRTKYQEFDIAQLVVDYEAEEVTVEKRADGQSFEDFIQEEYTIKGSTGIVNPEKNKQI